jgi:CheY-like chemotaxis protein
VASDSQTLKGINILVAEDNEYNQIVVNDTLTSLIDNASVDIAENGIEALDKVKSNDYDLVLMDAHMPEMDGLEATRQIRKLPGNKGSIPIIALTASVHKADIDKCLAAGMNSFVPKPFTRQELLGKLSEYYQLNQSNENKIERQTFNKKKSAVTKNEGITSMDFLKDFTEGDKGKMKKYIGLYLKLLPDNLSKLDDAILAGDLENLIKISHAMRPHLNYMGMKEAAQLAAEMEYNVHNKVNEDKVLGMAETIRDHCFKSKNELEKELTEFN